MTGARPFTAAGGAGATALGTLPPATGLVGGGTPNPDHHVTHHGSSTSSILPSPYDAGPAVIFRFVHVVPEAVWFALAAAVGIALSAAGLGLRSGFRARRQDKQFAAVTAAALTDPLTGILNRRGFTEAAERELARARRYQRPLALAFVDVRGLKAVNDTEGHLAGDELLKGVANLLKDSARAADVVGRLGGDELGLLLAEQTAGGAAAVSDRIREVVPARRAAMRLTAAWDLTIGISSFPEDGETLEELLAVADRRLYEQRGIELRNSQLQ